MDVDVDATSLLLSAPANVQEGFRIRASLSADMECRVQQNRHSARHCTRCTHACENSPFEDSAACLPDHRH